MKADDLHASPIPPPPWDRARMAAHLKTLFALRAAGDIDGLMVYVAEDVVCFPPTSWGYSRFPRTLYGKAAVREAFLQRRINYTFHEQTLHRLLIDGDQVILHRTGRTRRRGGGDLVVYDSVDILRFRDGLIVEFSEFPDGAARDIMVNYPF